LVYAIKVEILFRDIIAIGEGSWAPSVGLVPNDISAINGVDVNFNEDDNVLEGKDVLDDKQNLNTHGIDDIPTDLDKFGLAVQCRKERKEFKLLVNI
jgi:hypothetical protein